MRANSEFRCVRVERAGQGPQALVALFVVCLMVASCSLLPMKETGQGHSITVVPSGPRVTELRPGAFQPAGAPVELLGGASVTTAEAYQGHWMIGGGLGRVQLVDGGGEASTAALPLLGGHTILASTFSSAGTDQFFIIGGENGLLQVLHAGGKAKSEPASVIDGRVEAMNCGARKNRCLVVSWNEDQQTSDMRLIAYDGQPVGASRVLFDGHRVTALRFVASAWGPAADPGGSFIAGATGGKIRVIDSYGKPSGVEMTALHGADIRAIDWFGPGWLIGGAEGKLQLLFVGDKQSQRLSYRVSELGDVRSISCHRRLCLVIGSGGKAIVLEKKFKPGRSNDAEVRLADGGALSLLGGKQAHVACADFSGPQHRWLVAGEEGLTQVVEIDMH